MITCSCVRRSGVWRWTVIIAVTIVLVMEVTVDDVVDVVAVVDRRMAAAVAMMVTVAVAIAVVTRRATVGVLGIDRDAGQSWIAHEESVDRSASRNSGEILIPIL